ncbi:MAG: right-handed parallel beta-helix repeat-containing protein [Planctomycetes bacterium]|nr:right-handed parallel beta-helix repeat-containing protein [Planctomycetota bacterium]MCC7171327.1 right-handed parallel beta-helix repeat-containing protein [Planctomycetota bacterium]
MRPSVTLILGLFASGLANAGTIDVPADHSTIQQAIDAATSGDTIRIKAGTYFENLSVAGKRVHLKGLGNIVVDGLASGVPHGPVVWFKAGANGSSMRGLTVRHGRTMGTPGYGVLADAQDLLIEKCRILACEAEGIRMTADACRVRKCVIEGCGGGVSGGSDHAVVENNVLNGLLGEGIDVSGKSPRVVKNRIERVENGIGIQTVSSGTEIVGNVVRLVTDEYAMRIAGEFSIVSGNTIEFGSDDDTAVSIAAPNVEFRKNRIRSYTSAAIFVAGSAPGALLEKNTIERVGSESEPTISVSAAQVTLVKNVVRDVDGPGIRIAASNVVLESNSIVGAGRDGIVVDVSLTGIEIIGNSVKGCFADGMDLRSVPSVFEKNVVLTNRTDVATTFFPSFSSTNKLGVVGTSTLD